MYIVQLLLVEMQALWGRALAEATEGVRLAEISHLRI